MTFSLIILVLVLASISVLEHLFWADLARRKPVIGYTIGVLGVLVPTWLWALWAHYNAYVSDAFLKGLALISLSFVPFGAMTALLHYRDRKLKRRD